MKKALTLLIIIQFTIIGSLPLFSLGQNEKEIEFDIYFFYLEACPGCESYEMAESLSKTINKLARENKTISGETNNILIDKDSKRMMEVLEMKNLTEISHAIPLLIINDTYFVGYEDISVEIAKLEG